ncbi:MAG: PAS domain S-box protein [Elusimicrobia bacterium]|nr:PAS domain S-box protein [Elusimicrobiota bacterium]
MVISSRLKSVRRLIWVSLVAVGTLSILLGAVASIAFHGHLDSEALLVGGVILVLVVPLVIPFLLYVARQLKERDDALRLTQFTINQTQDARKQAEIALQASETKFRSIAESATDGVVVADKAGTIIYWNNSARKMFGFYGDQVFGKSVLSLLPERYHETLKQEAEQLLKTGAPEMEGKILELHGLNRNGYEFPVEMSMSTWETDTNRYFASIIRDVSERKAAESNLLFQANILSQVKDAVIAIDINGRITYWNTAAEQTYGRKMVEVIGQKLEEVISTCRILPEEGSRDHERLLDTGYWFGEDIHVCKDGQELTVEFKTSVLRDENGRRIGHLAVVRDVTERKRLEDMVLHSEKMAAMGQMAAGVAYQLKTPMTIILGFVEVVSRKINSHDALSTPLEAIKTQALRCAGLIDNLIDFSRKEQPVFQEIDLHEAIASALLLIEPRARGNAIAIHKEFSITPLRVRGYKDMIEQVILNLTLNAVDAMPRGGVLTIHTRHVTRQDRVYTQIQVSDTGVGIPVDLQKKLFEPFFTTKGKDQGAGLGLWLVKEIIVSQGGRIEVTSQESKGTTLTVFLPAA